MKLNGDNARFLKFEIMSKQTVYFIDPAWKGAPDDSSDAVVETHHQILDAFDLARELWALAGYREKSDDVESILNEAYQSATLALNAEQLRRLVDLFTNLKLAVMQAGFLDEAGYTPAARMAEVRERTTCVDVGVYRGEAARHGVFEAIEKVETLTELLQRAQNLQLHVALD
ncbi:MAG TPA: hypothetical protein PLF40_02235 [Kofleriaceae bacterium]|nr:hypothetical protein [Kofleriaceae bacterium]